MSIEASAVARVLGITTEYKNLRRGNTFNLPQRIAVVAQGTTAATFATTKRQVTSALEVGQVYGFGSPLHLIATMLFPQNGDGVGTIPVTVYPLDDHASGVVAEGVITPTGTQTTTQTYYARIGGVLSEAFTLPAACNVATACDSIVAAINGTPAMPVIATDGTTTVDLEAKWKGASGNDIAIEILGTVSGITFGITDMASGATNPSVAGALAQIGDVWETLVLNGLDIADTTNLGLYATFGEGRWGTLVNKPLVVFTGNTIASRASATAVSAARTTDYTNAQLVAPGSPTLPCMVAARQLVRIARTANGNPPTDYGALRADGIVPGLDSEQWNYTDRDTAVKAGSSTVEVRDGEVTIGDVVTFYAPSGDPLPKYRYVVDIVKLQNTIYNIALIFSAAEWAGAPMIPDAQPTTNRNARKPRQAVAAARAMVDSLALAAIMSDPDAAKAATTCTIDGSNPKRFNLRIGNYSLSGNTNVKNITLEWGFYFGTPGLAA